MLIWRVALVVVVMLGPVWGGKPDGSDQCVCCGQPSGRYCGFTLNQKCGQTDCVANSIYYCFSTYPRSERVRYCPGATYGHQGCLQVALGSARCGDT